jgi:hypothetical protein
MDKVGRCHARPDSIERGKPRAEVARDLGRIAARGKGQRRVCRGARVAGEDQHEFGHGRLRWRAGEARRPTVMDRNGGTSLARHLRNPAE